MKFCKTCNIEKQLDRFQFRKDTNKFRGSCIECENLRKKNWSKNNVDKVKITNQKYLSNNEEKRKESIKKYYIKHFDKIQDNQRNWRLNNQVIYKNRRAENYKINKEKWILYYNTNKEQRREWYNLYKKERFKNDKLYKLSENIRSLIRSSFKNKSLNKESKSTKILCCTFEYFEIWLNSISKVSPLNENCHLDHVIPISFAINEKEILLLNHYSNFQWLTVQENTQKGNRFSYKNDIRRVIKEHPFSRELLIIIKREKLKML